MPRTATKQVTKTDLLEKGTEIMLEKGYNNTGIQEVLDTCNVPKGSFYYYFSSKEDFALQIIDHFDTKYGDKLREYLDNPSMKPIDRLRLYCETAIKSFEDNNCRKGCLIGNLSQEMSDQSEVLRVRLEETMAKSRDKFAACIKEGQDAGEIKADLDAVETAKFFLSSWHGAILLAKTTKTTEPQKAFVKMMFGKVLAA